MSVTFYDPSNLVKYNEDGDQIGGGLDINVSNGNAFEILLALGLCTLENPVLWGTLDGDTFRKCCIKALLIIHMKELHPNDYRSFYLSQKINRLLTVFADCETVNWD